MREHEDHYWWYLARRSLIRSLTMRHLPPRARVLDMGCGTGGLLDTLAAEGEIVGADLSPTALGFCRERGHECLLQTRAEQLAVADGTMDAVVCCEVLEHIEDDAAGLREAWRVLRPGGVIVLTVPAYEWLWSDHDVALDHQRRYSKRALRERLKDLDGEVVKLSYAVSFVFPLVLIIRLLRRLKLQQVGQPHTKLMSMPRPINRVLLWVQSVEEWLMRYVPMPFGSSLIAVVRKPRG